MGKNSAIEWTDHTFNTHWGCFKISPGCANCYADTQAKRYGYEIWGPAHTTTRRVFGDAHWREPLTWEREALDASRRYRVFCNSFSDVFEDHPLLPPVRERLWQLIRETPQLDWLLLTKRPENIGGMLPGEYWPNVWLGTSTENQEYADKRVPLLLEHRDRVPILFLSVEPQLERVTFRWRPWVPISPTSVNNHLAALRGVDWIISGGESGPRHRPFDVQWARDLRDECREANVAFFFKQHGGITHAEGGCLIDGFEVKELPTPRVPVAA